MIKIEGKDSNTGLFIAPPEDPREILEKLGRALECSANKSYIEGKMSFEEAVKIFAVLHGIRNFLNS